MVEEVQSMKARSGADYRAVCEAAGVAYSSLMRWKRRQARGEAAVGAPGPRKVEPFDLEGLHEQTLGMKHGQRRTPGTGALYQAVKPWVSRRALQALVDFARRELQREQHALDRRIEWNVPRLTWSMDDSELERDARGRRRFLHNVQDLASRYKLSPMAGALPHGETVAANLRELFELHGAPLVLKRDNGGNLNHHAVNELLGRRLVIPLNSPPHYPPYNGAIERSQEEMKRRLRPVLGDAVPEGLTAHARLAAHDLNHKRRKSLARRTSCEVFLGGSANLKAYNRRQRKEAYDQIKALAMHIAEGLDAARAAHGKTETADTVWRLAVETWLHRKGLITVWKDGKVLPNFPLEKSHN